MIQFLNYQNVDSVQTAKRPDSRITVCGEILGLRLRQMLLLQTSLSSAVTNSLPKVFVYVHTCKGDMIYYLRRYVTIVIFTCT